MRLLFLAMSPSPTLSIAAPASFWYLKNFLIRAMSYYLDYIVYMTYDFHGMTCQTYAFVCNGHFWPLDANFS
jgi:GH18 family chitinase